MARPEVDTCDRSILGVADRAFGGDVHNRIELLGRLYIA
jgi:hypothetical protein